MKSVGKYPTPETSVNSVKSVGEYPTPETSVNSVKSVGEYPTPKTSVNSVKSVGGLQRVAWVWQDAIPSYENSHSLHSKFAEEYDAVA